MKNKANVIHAQVRSTAGKGSARKDRRAGLLPAIVYSGGRDASSICVYPREIGKLLHSPLRRNVLIELDVKDENGKDLKPKTVMVRDLQVHPVKRDLLHMDFVEIDPTQPVTVKVPIQLTGKSKAVTAGGKLEQVLHQLSVKSLPADIPASIAIDITDLKMGSTHASDLEIPAGLELATSSKAAILNIKIPKSAEEEEAAEAAAAEAAAGVPDAAAAPEPAAEEKKA